MLLKYGGDHITIELNQVSNGHWNAFIDNGKEYQKHIRKKYLTSFIEFQTGKQTWC